VSGPPENVRDAIAHMMKRVEVLEEEAKDRELRNHRESVQVPADLHTKLIGPKGSTINRIRAKFNVNIMVPRADSEQPEQITVIGYEKDALACKEEIEQMVNQIQSQFTQETTLDARIHNRLIGPKGKNIKKIMDDYKVEIRFPRQSDPDPNLVAVSGSSEDAVFDCIDHLRNLEEEFLQDVSEFKPRQQANLGGYMSPMAGGGNSAAPPPPTEFLITNGPWNTAAPNITNLEDFPSMGNGENGVSHGGSTTGAWGKPKF
jgi:polyribonucleotide nucleotidyltransferase